MKFDETHLSQLASVGQIAAGIAHEVKNPLTAVKGFLQLLQQEETHEYLDIAQTELDQALSTLNGLLQVAKPELEDEQHQPIYLAVELESILNLFQDKLYNIQVITNYKHYDAAVVGKKSQFKKAFFNLIKNAIEAMGGEGILTITHECINGEVIVTIKDTGAGVPEDKLPLLGTPFYSTKAEGTGMGLTQVFSAIYQHGGNITVESKENEGTTFIIKMRQQEPFIQRGVRNLQLHYEDDFSIQNFLFENRQAFEERLMEEAINVKDKIEEIHSIGNINLVNNAHKLVLFVVERKVHDLISFAKQEGVAWAKYSLTLAFKLEWIQAIRRTLWDFLYHYELLSNKEPDRAAFFTMEKNVNEMLDQFHSHFFISYSKYKDELLYQERKLVENLSVPIIPINDEICILPLIGKIDGQRIQTIQNKVFDEVDNSHIQTLIIDLSGVASMEEEATGNLQSIIEGISMMGCRTILTGFRSDLVKTLLTFGLSSITSAEYKGTLKLALKDVFIQEQGGALPQQPTQQNGPDCC